MTIDLWPDLWAIVAATYVPQQRVQKGPIQGTRNPKSIDTHMVKLIYMPILYAEKPLIFRFGPVCYVTNVVFAVHQMHTKF